VVLALAAVSRAQPPDPISVFFPASECDTDVLEVQVWNRQLGEWQPHSEHPRIFANSCQVEDAGVLLNETRIRCLNGDGSQAEHPWRKVQVWNPIWMESCPRPARPRTAFPLAVRTSTPRSGDLISSLERTVEIRGWVTPSNRPVSGLDLVIVFDTSPQIQRSGRHALVGLLRSLRDRPETTRVGLVRFSSAIRSRAGVGPEASLKGPLLVDPIRVEEALLRPPAADDAALDAVEALTRALNALDSAASKDPGGDPLPPLRSLVLVVEGSGPYPFGRDTGLMPRYRSQVLRIASRAGAREIHLHILGLQSSETAAPELARQMRTRALGSLQWRGTAQPGLELILQQRILPAVAQLEIENLDTGARGMELMLEPFGRFRGKLALREGANRIAIRAQLSPDGQAQGHVEVLFDSSQPREEWKRIESQRIERERGRQGRKHLVIEADE